jgi:hypothetical protein
VGNRTEPFRFFTERRLTQLTGLRARNLLELLGHLRTVTGSSIFYHTYHRFLAHHFEKPQVDNDFAVWTVESLQEPALAERLAALDLRAFTTVRDLRNAIVDRIEGHIDSGDARGAGCPAAEDFHFCKSRSFILCTNIVAADPRDFFAKLPQVTNVSIFFHFIEARLRLLRPTNDFSAWLEYRGRNDLAEAIDQLDPYALTLDELKQAIAEIGRNAGDF